MARFHATAMGDIPFTPEEELARDMQEAAWELSLADRAAEEVRTERNAKLTSSDWTQIADAPVDKAAWATYRQALRDLPQQAGFPTSINWPVKP